MNAEAITRTGAGTGLEGIVVADTRLSEVDGQRGRVVVRGEPLEALGERGFVAACGLMWDGAWPDEARTAALEAGLSEGRERALASLARAGDALERDDAMAALRAALSQLEVPASWPEDALALTGAMAVYAAAWARRQRGEAPVAPSSLDHAADYLRMLRGEAPREEEARAMGSYLATVIEHGFNASTFAARVVASTEASTGAAVLAGLGALEGRLHGGAPGPVLDMLDAIGTPEAARGWLAGELDAGRRIMGMGHRVYRVRDPRAGILEAALSRLGPGGARVALARRVEQEAEALLSERKPGRSLRANVEFFTALLLEALGVPRTLFTGTFAVARVAGWCAHVQEQRSHGRLIRPRARYVGARPAA